MTAILALIAAAGIVMMIRAIVVIDRAEKVMAEVAEKAREVLNLAESLKAQNDAMRESNVETYKVGNTRIAKSGGMNWYC